MRLRSQQRLNLGYLFLVLVAAFCAWVRDLVPPAPPQHVVVLVYDTLRADRMSIYGNPRLTTPFIDELSDELLRFDSVKAPAPWTIPSHASMFTGLWPAEHGAQWGHSVLDERHVTLAETLRDEGFYTVGYSVNRFLATETGLIQGFEDFELFHSTRRILEELPVALERARTSGRRLFLFINVMDAHIPHNLARYGARFGVEGKGPVWSHAIKWGINEGWHAFSASDRVAHLASYDAAVRYLDDVTAELVELLRARRLLDETLLVLTSDHGEGLGWHPEIGHSVSVWEEQLDVPLLVRFPRARRGGQVFRPTTTLTALAPSLLDWLGVRRPAQMAAAPDLERAASTPVSADYRSYFSELERVANAKVAAEHPRLAARTSHLHALYCGQHKLLISARGETRLYDLAADPMEERDLAQLNPALTDACLARYHDLVARGRFTPFAARPAPLELAPAYRGAQLETLRSLGYIQ